MLSKTISSSKARVEGSNPSENATVLKGTNMLKDIQLLITGGTIDAGADYNPNSKAVYLPGSKSNIKTYIEKFIKPNITIYETIICLVDSQDITDAIREKIYTAIKNSKSQNIIITHGTDTMVQTCKYLADKIRQNGTDKKIVLVGAFQPLSFAQSDAPFCLGYAIGQIEHLSPNVYIAMNSQIFNADNVEKDFSTMKFKTRNQKKSPNYLSL